MGISSSLAGTLYFLLLIVLLRLYVTAKAQMDEVEVGICVAYTYDEL